MKPPNGIEEIREVFGDPRPYVLDDGSVSPVWESMILKLVELPAPLSLGWDPSRQVNRVRVHHRIALDVERVFSTLYDDGLWPLIKTFDGCYAWRAKRVSARLSAHAWAVAIDLNSATNRIGTPGDMPFPVVQAFREHGWVWGGDEKLLGLPDADNFDNDPMHFQFCSGY